MWQFFLPFFEKNFKNPKNGTETEKLLYVEKEKGGVWYTLGIEAGEGISFLNIDYMHDKNDCVSWVQIVGDVCNSICMSAVYRVS